MGRGPGALWESLDCILRALGGYRKMWGRRVMWLQYGGRTRRQRGEGGRPSSRPLTTCPTSTMCGNSPLLPSWKRKARPFFFLSSFPTRHYCLPAPKVHAHTEPDLLQVTWGMYRGWEVMQRPMS